MTAQKTPTVLIILDGWGHRSDSESNAIHGAATPTWDRLWNNYPHRLISGSGLDVGLPDGQMGNSEVGHMSLGAGRIVYQSITRIDKSIADGDFFNNSAYTQAVDKAVENGKAVHLMGLMSPGGVHSHEAHIFAMAKLAADRGAEKLYVHCFLDGRDTPPRSAQASLEKLQDELSKLGKGQVASIIGRYYAMDRDNRWDRVEAAYNMLTRNEAPFRYDNAVEALQAAYERDENDEFVQASLINGAEAISDGDALIFMNFRADRAREITRAFVDEQFDGFERGQRLNLADFVMTTEYAADIKTSCAFPPERLANVFGEYLANNDMTQLRIAETEKYAHVTFFFSGGREELFDGETRELIASPDVATYDLQPEMSAPEVTEKLVAAITGGEYDAIVCNFANGDMVGHTGVYDAAVKAVEALDGCLAQVVDAVESVDGNCLITADHGNCEQMQDPNSGQAHTAHTCEPVPLVYVGAQNVSFDDSQAGRLCDVAPSLLALMQVSQPEEMTGHSLVHLG
jgi:2,3-bisphosphoglycerate-independent phosphoglycerate mutase